MHDLKWTAAEKKLARRVFDAALEAELGHFLAAFKARAAAVTDPAALWALEDVLKNKRREIEGKYDYRYSQLILVLGVLLREGRIHERDLEGLSEDKLAPIRRMLSL